MIEIKQVVTKRQWKKFAGFPIDLYKANPNYVPVFLADDVHMANEKKNFAAKGCIVRAFLAYKDGVLAGRIAGIIIPESNRVHNDNAVRYSRFDFIEDIEVARSLLDAVIAFGKEHGMGRIHGPWGFNDTDREGMLTYGFDEPGSYATNYNFPYYPAFLQELGYTTESSWIEEDIILPKPNEEYYEKILKVSEFVKRKYKLRELADTLSVKQVVKRYGDKFFDCYNAAYKDLDMFFEISGEAKKTVLSQFATIINEDYYSVIVDEHDDVVAFCIALPSLAEPLKKHGGKMTLGMLIDLVRALKHPSTLELTIMAVRPEFKMYGYNAACFGRLFKNIGKNKLKRVVSCPSLESNTAIRAQWNKMQSEVIKRRSTYTKSF